MSSSPPPSPERPATASLVHSALRFSGPRPTTQQQRFNRLLERSDSLAERIAAVQALGDQFHQHDARQLEPLRAQRDTLLRQMALHLDQRLGQPGLARSQQQQIRDLVCSITDGLAERGDEVMRALYDMHSDTPWSSRRAHPMAETTEEDPSTPRQDGDTAGPVPTEAATPAADGTQDGGAETAAEAEEAQARDRAREAARAAHQARRQQAAQRKKQQKKGKASPTTTALDPDSALRAIYRQLARALHPDLEQDAPTRLRKTALMGEANQAYAQRDLPTLLRLQVEAAASDTTATTPSPMAEERLDALNHLLQERVERLNTDLQAQEHALRAAFGMHPRDPVNEAALRRYVGYDKADLAEDIAQLHAELRSLEDDEFFKRWLRTQHKLLQQSD